MGEKQVLKRGADSMVIATGGRGSGGCHNCVHYNMIHFFKVLTMIEN